MRHRADARHVLHQLDVLVADAELVVGDDRADRLAAELAELRRVDVLVEAGLDRLRRILEVVQELILRGAQHLDADVLPEIGAVDDELEAAPGRLERLVLLVVQDGIELGGDLAVDLGDHLVDDGVVDLLVGPRRLHQLGNERRDAALGDVVALVVRAQPRLVQDLVEDRRLGRRRGAGVGGRLDIRVRHERSTPVAGGVRRVIRLRACRRGARKRAGCGSPRPQARPGSPCGRPGTLPSGPFRGEQRVAELEQPLQLGDLPHHLLGLEVAQPLELQRHCHLLVAGGLVELAVDAEVETEVVALQHLVEGVLVDRDERPLVDRPIICLQRIVADHQELQRQLDFFLGVADRRLVADVDALLGSD